MNLGILNIGTMLWKATKDGSKEPLGMRLSMNNIFLITSETLNTVFFATREEAAAHCC